MKESWLLEDYKDLDEIENKGINLYAVSDFGPVSVYWWFLRNRILMRRRTEGSAEVYYLRYHRAAAFNIL